MSKACASNTIANVDIKKLRNKKLTSTEFMQVGPFLNTAHFGICSIYSENGGKGSHTQSSLPIPPLPITLPPSQCRRPFQVPNRVFKNPFKGKNCQSGEWESLTLQTENLFWKWPSRRAEKAATKQKVLYFRKSVKNAKWWSKSN